VKPKGRQVDRPSSIQGHRGFDRTVHFFLILHDQEWVKVQIAEEPDIGPNQQNKREASENRHSAKTRYTQNVLHSPIVLEVLEELMLEEERRVIAAWNAQTLGSVTGLRCIRKHENLHMFR
jgi:hypothetical protein